MWKKVLISTDSPFFNIFSQIIKEVKPGEKTITKTIINKRRSQQIRTQVTEKYKFAFDWQDDNEDICGIELYKELVDNE